ncbi:hypothetical protein AB1N83_014348 [Pleurotus pulmonarius]|nr:hypothetical protein EYR38_001943 [Pleurotus pulmonarius]
MASKKMRDEDSRPNTTKGRSEEDMLSERRRKVPDIPKGATVISPSKTDKKDNPQATHSRGKYVPCQPPTIREGEKVETIPVVWKVVVNDTQEGGVAHPGVRVESTYDAIYPPERKLSNPHWGYRTPIDPSGIIKNNPTIPFTKAPMPRYVLSDATIYGNMDGNIAKYVRNTNESLVAAIPFGAGNELYENDPRLLRTVETFLKSISRNEERSLTISPPAAEGKPPYRARFAKPFAMMIQGMSTGLKTALLEFQTFAFRYNETPYALFFVDPAALTVSWIICNFRGGLVTDDREGMSRALEAIVQRLLDLPMARGTANELLREEGIGRDAEERIHMAISSLSLTFINRRDTHGNHDPVWQLQGRPMTYDLTRHRKWLRVVRQTTYIIGGTARLETEKKMVACVWCKLETHASENCPFPDTRDWKGPPRGEGFHEPEPRDARQSPKAKEGKRGKKDKTKSKGSKGTAGDEGHETKSVDDH